MSDEQKKSLKDVHKNLVKVQAFGLQILESKTDKTTAMGLGRCHVQGWCKVSGEVCWIRVVLRAFRTLSSNWPRFQHIDLAEVHPKSEKNPNDSAESLPRLQLRRLRSRSAAHLAVPPPTNNWKPGNMRSIAIHSRLTRIRIAGPGLL